jgi:hypothetical protein
MEEKQTAGQMIDEAWQKGVEARALRFALADNPWDATLGMWWARGWHAKDAELRAEALEALPHRIGLLLWNGLCEAQPLMTDGAREHMTALLKRAVDP